jgi:hypothetical protein
MNTRGYVLPFLVALVICAGAFLALDAAVMNMQGLSLIFHK